MRRSLAMKALTAVAVGLLILGHLSPVAAGMLLCVADESDPDCCDEREAPRDATVEASTRLLDGSDCGCCVEVGAAPATPGASSPGPARLSGSPAGATGESGLSSLRTVVLVI
jgi:hypothetical protein